MARSLGTDTSGDDKQPVLSINTGRRSIGRPLPVQDNLPNEPEYIEPDDAHEKIYSKKRLQKGIIIGLASFAAATAGLFCYSYFFGNIPYIDQVFSFFTKANAANENVALIYDDGKIYDRVSALGVDLSGMNVDEAREALLSAAAEKIKSVGVTYKVGEDNFFLGSQDMGTEITVDDALNQAISYGRQGSFEERMNAIKTAADNGYEIPVEVSFHKDTLIGTLKNNGAVAPVEPVNASLKLEKVSDEEKLITDMKISYIDGKSGSEVNIDKLADDILAAAEAGDTSPVIAEVTEIQPKLTSQNIKDTYVERGVFSTEFKSSKDGRRYNVWKMSDIINGVKLEPGETWSINEEAGPRTFALGWQAAPGINEGVYKEEAGGGICQVSSTLYNAVLRAEVDIVDRSHHSWPLEYVDGGLDATISTGAPDFKIKNNFDIPIYIVARCDGEGERKVEVAILAPPHEDGLTRDFVSELVEEYGKEDPIIILDSSMPKGERYEIIKEHKGKVFNVYKRLLDSNGNEVSKELAYTDTYAYKPAKIRVGTGSVAESTPQPEQQPAQTTPEVPNVVF